MDRMRMIVFLALLVGGALLAACGSEPDPVATEVAVQQAAAATLTAAARTQPPEPTQVAQAPAATPAADDTAPPPPPSPTTAPVQPPATASPTPIVVDVEPAVTQTTAPTATPEPTPTPVLVAVLPVDGGGGDIPNIRNNNPVKDGRNVTLPGFAPAEVTEPMVFRDRMVFQIEVFDSNVGTTDGAGIDRVEFTITDDLGNLVFYNEETNPAYCVFAGGEPDCNVWVFDQTGFRWPDGGPRLFPVTYNVTIDIHPQSGDVVQWFWSFQVALPYDAARINGITEQGGSYAVDFETFGFTPELPGQHVHFFFDTVPPDQAGSPGGGPWELYGGPSPFTVYGPADRPAGATQLCILVANPDHSVQANTGNCFPLP